MEATQVPAAETGATEPEAAQARPLTLVSPSDEVGFGKHGLMTYEEAWVQEPQYCMWVITTFRKEISEGLEDETSWKEGDRMMKRFAQWLMEKEKNCEAHGPAFEYNADMELVEVPSSRSLRDRVGGSQEKKAKFYGVAKPEKRICTSWEECKPFVHGVKGVLYRSFATREEAEAYINNPPTSVRSQKQGTTGESGEAKKKSRAKKKQSPEDLPTEAQKGKDESPPVSKKRKSATKATTEVPKKSDEAVASEKTDSNEAEMKKAKKTPKVAATSKAKAKAKAKAEAKTPKAKAAKVKAEESEEKNEKKAKAKAAKATKVKAEESEDKETKAANADNPKTEATDAAGEVGSNISEEVLTTAENCGLKTALMNLAARPEIAKLQLDGHCLLQTLKECNGLVNKAKAQLLENGPSTPPKSQSTAQTETPEKATIPAEAKEMKVAESKVETNPEPQPMEIETVKATPIEPAQRTVPMPVVPVSAVVAPVAQTEKKVLDENSCRNCETPFADSIFCRSCGMARPKKARVSAPPQQVAPSPNVQEVIQAAPSPNIQEVIQANRERALARKRQAAASVAGA